MFYISGNRKPSTLIQEKASALTTAQAQKPG